MPAGPGRHGALILGGGFGFHTAAHAGFPVGAGAGVGQGRVTVGAAPFAGQGNAETHTQQALFAAPLAGHAHADAGVGAAFGVAAAGADAGPGTFRPGQAKFMVVLENGLDPAVRASFQRVRSDLGHRARQGQGGIVAAQALCSHPGPALCLGQLG